MPKQFSIDPQKLRKNPWNTNVVSPENEAKLAESLRTLGMFKPIIVRELRDEATDTDFEILGGEHRWEAAIKQGLTSVPVFNVGPVDDDTAKKISLADNARYGTDDVIELSKLLKGLENSEELQNFLPYTEADLTAIFASEDIAFDELDLDDPGEKSSEPAEPATRAPKTHTIMRFKVPIEDAERITELIARVQKREGFTSSDEMTNAGDALVHLLLARGEPE